MKKSSLVKLGLVAAVTFGVIGVGGYEAHQYYNHKLTVANENERVINNLYRSLADKDGVITDSEKVHFLRSLGVTATIQSGTPLEIVGQKGDTFMVLYGVHYTKRDDGYVASPNLLGPFTKVQIEKYANDNIKWIE